MTGALRRLTVAGALAGVAACGAGQPRYDVVDPAQVYRPAQVDELILLDCPGYSPPSGYRWIARVVIEYVVAASGRVEPSTLQVIPRGGQPPDASAEREARAAAATCTYEPPRRRGQPVRVRVRRMFTVHAY